MWGSRTHDLKVRKGVYIGIDGVNIYLEIVSTIMSQKEVYVYGEEN